LIEWPRCEYCNLCEDGPQARPRLADFLTESLSSADPREPRLKSVSTPYNRGLHRFAVFTAAATFVLIIAGALVTSNDAGLSVPDWPTSFGSLYKMPQMVGGVRFEHTHRTVAEFVGLLTIVLAIWTWRADHRHWMRILGVAALGTVVAQGILGGITVLFFLPPAISSAHAALAQTFFCIAVAIALFTGRKWVEEVPEVDFDTRRPSLVTLTLLSIFVLYVQLFLGAMFRHKGMSWWPHVLNAAVVAVVLSWTAIRALTQYSRIEAVRRPAIILLSLMIAQLGFGFLAFQTRVALLLATAVILSIQVWRHVPVAFQERIPDGERKPVAA